MKPVISLLLIIGLALSHALLAQKSAPVAGDAAELVNLLRKDYNSLDPFTRNEELIKDRAFVVSTFKSYMTEAQKNTLKTTVVTTPIAKYNTQLLAYRKAQQLLNSYSTTVTATAANDAEAVKLRGILEGLSNDVETKSEAYYRAKCISDVEELNAIITVYTAENKYVAYVIDQFAKKYATIDANGADALAKNNPNASLQKGVPFLGGDMGFEMVIEGLSKFLAKRIKEELTTQVIEKIQEWLQHPNEDDPLAELKVLLPRTNAYLLNFKAGQITNFPNEIKQYIEDDFNHIVENMNGLRNTPRIKRLVASYPDVDFAMEALELIPSLSKIKNPVDYFDIIENSRNLNRWKESADPVKFNIANTLRLSSMLAHSLTIVDSGQPRFAGSDFFSTYGGELNFYLLYVGFLYQQNIKYYDIGFKFKPNTRIPIKKSGTSTGDTLSLAEFPLREGLRSLVSVNVSASNFNLDTLNSNREFLETLFFQISNNAEKVYTSAMEIRKANKNGQKIGADSVYTFVKSIIDLAEEVTSSGDTLVTFLMANIDIKSLDDSKLRYEISLGKGNTQPLRLKEKTQPYFAVAHKTNDIVLDLQKKKYTTAILKALEVTALVLPDRFTQSMILLSNAKEWKSEHWSKVIPLIKATPGEPEVQIENSAITSATLVYGELIKIKNYYQVQYTNNALDGIATLVDKVKMMSTGKLKISTAEAALLQKLLADKNFHYLVISYYTKLRVDEFANTVEKQMRHLTVTINGQTQRVFAETETADFKKYFLAYVDAAFEFLTDNDKEKFKKAGTEFSDFALSFLARAPVKMNMPINENTLKLIHFINDMAVAQNSDDVSKAIEAFALPAGSYSIKRDAIFNISINSYPGILPAVELTWKNKVCYGSFSPAFTAPVGFSFTASKGKGRSYGLFMPIIDIGALTRMYLGSDSTEIENANTLPEFSFLSVFSPGLYWHWGFKKTPLSLHVGAQYGPGLREVTSTGETQIYESVRFGIGCVLDIPLLNLHTKPRY